MLRDTSELRQPLAKEAVVVFISVCVRVTDDVGARVRDSQMAVYLPLPVNRIY